MNISQPSPVIPPARAVTDVPPVVEEQLGSGEREDLVARIKALLVERDAVLVAHYYTSADLQRLAEETGGCVSASLEMARFGHASEARTLGVAGARVTQSRGFYSPVTPTPPCRWMASAAQWQ